MSIKDEYSRKMEQAMSILNMIADDNTTPRNIRRTAKQAADMLLDESLSVAARAANAIAILEDISQDPNMPMYSRTRIWNAISVLEGIRD
ncbi:UPF0147 family protein [Candidatus Bathyarchaeota archaeon]|jgi:uncharacterized protein (UPF0147 family)|nr:UPF0147 family protein [Candidatus Bathyarchaeota archaeon]MCK4400612.1 UPF0147 family protein [Candidatus Bathyarchaeota archaeon]MCK4703204.1 UPF0147 family protein [Candidatus Bathyarchaeota archaeon]